MLSMNSKPQSSVAVLNQPRLRPITLENAYVETLRPAKRRATESSAVCWAPSSASSSGVTAPSKVCEKRTVAATSTRTSITSTLDLVHLNRTAIRLFHRGDVHSAQELFFQALSKLKLDPFDAKAHDFHLPQEDEPPKSSYIYQRMDFDEGMDVYASPEPITADDYPTTVIAILRFNIGQCKCKLGDYETATSFFEAALQAVLPSLTTNTRFAQPTMTQDLLLASSLLRSMVVHPIIVPILHCLGFAAYRHGNLNKAIGYYTAALKCTRTTTACMVRETNAATGSVVGQEEVATGLTLNCLGVLFYHKVPDDVTNRAMSYFLGSLQILTGVLGPRSAAVATALNNLGRVMVQKEDLVSALDYYEKALEIRRECLGMNHIDYAATAFNAGQSLHQLGRYDRAIYLYQEFLKVAKVRFSSNHRDVAVVLSGMAQIHQKRKEHDRARELHEESLRVGRAALGNNHSEVAMLLNRVGNYYFEREDYNAALRAYKEGLKIEHAVLGESHPNIIVTLSNIGEIYRQKGMLNRAIKLYTKAMELQKLRHGQVSAEVAGTLNVLGLIHDQKGDSAAALNRLQEALVMRRSVLGENHLDVSATLTFLGTLFYRRNMVSIALRLFGESLRIRSAALGMDHRDVSFVLYNIGLCHQVQGNHAEAIRCFKETLRIEKEVLGDRHRDVSLTLLKLGEAYKAEGDLKGALESFTAALEIEKSLVDKEDPASIARTLVEIGHVHLAKHDVKHMMASFSEAARIMLRQGRLINNVNVSQTIYPTEFGEGNCASAA